MKIKGLVLAMVVLLAAYVVGGNLYLKVRVKKTLDSQLSQWERKVERSALPGKGIRVEVEDVKPSFTLLPFISPSQSFVVRGIRCSFPRGELSLDRLTGTVSTSWGRVKGIRLKAMENLEARSLDGDLDFSVKRVVFTPVLDLTRFLGGMEDTGRTVGGRAEKISLSFIDKRGGEMDLAIQEATFKEEVDMGREGDTLPEKPLKSRLFLKGMTVDYRAVGGGKGTGEAHFSYVGVHTGLEKDQPSAFYVFREEIDTELSRLNLAHSGKGKINPQVLLPLKASFKMELSHLSEGLVSSFMGLLKAYRDQDLDQEQRLAATLQFFQKALPAFMVSTLRGDALLSFPQDSSISFHFRERIMDMMGAIRSGNPLWVTVRVRGKKRLLSLLTRAGFKDEALEKFFSGFVCDKGVCEKRIPLGRGSHKS